MWTGSESRQWKNADNQEKSSVIGEKLNFLHSTV